ncbi:MAG: uracil-DNA glycosylase family protein [Planctomycetaceae bacterium]
MNQRVTRQYLESLKRAGVTHLPTVTAPPAQPVQAAAESAATQTAPAPPVHPKPSPAPKPVAPAVETVPAALASSMVPPEPVAVPELPANASAADKQAALNIVAQNVAACVRCQELANTRKQTVFGVGNPDARILFIGEAPGADEDRIGEPFVGRAGKLLDDIITACKLQREDVYICNILRCRPPGNRNPSSVEAGNCREYLDAQIAIVKPEYIVCWGSVAAHNLMGDDSVNIGRMRGKFFTYGDAKVLCTYHPSYLLRNPPVKKKVWDDMKFLFADMGVSL